MNKIEVSIILACFNEGPTFERSIGKIIAELKKLKKSWEIIFVEDQSYDNTRTAVKRWRAKLQNSRAIYHDKNQGRGKSVSDGIKAARGDICGYLDVDLEVSENYIPLFIKEIENGNDLAVGKRFYESSFDSLSRVIASKVYSLAVKTLLGLPIEDTEAGYKFFKRKKILSILPKIKSNHWFWDTEICAQAYWEGNKISQVPVIFKRRPEKKSTVKLIPDTIDYIKNLYRLREQFLKSNGKQK